MTYDWDKAFREAVDMAGDYVRSGTTITDDVAIWVLLIQAVKDSRTFSAPPRSGYPTKSAWPDTEDEISYWHKMAAFVRGELDEEPVTDWKPPLPSAEAITRADAVLHLWHHSVTLGQRKKKAVYLKACGAKDGRVRRVSGLTTQEIKNAKRRAMREMLGAIAL